MALITAMAAGTAGAQPVSPPPRPEEPGFAFVGVSLVSMESDRITPDSVVIVGGDRITAVGTRATVVIPDGATIIEGRGRYLLPGLVDSHVHLTEDMPWAPARAEFGDGPIYLAYGVTTVVNLRGTDRQLAWRRRVIEGTLVGPTIYTAGEFVNESQAVTPEEVRREILAQRRNGFDLIKFREVPGTTTSLSPAAYRQMMATTREIGMPIVGHAPLNLGLDAMLQAQQPLAHAGMLSNLYFRPTPVSLYALLITAGALLLLLPAAIAAAIAPWRRHRTGQAPAESAANRVRSWSGSAMLTGTLAFAAVMHVLPGAPFAASDVLRVLVTACALLLLVIAVRVVMATIAVWRSHSAGPLARVRAAYAALSTMTLALCLAIFWTPLVWRSSGAGITRIAERFRAVGVPVQSTLVVYDLMTTTTRARLMDDDAIAYLRADTRAMWKALPREGLPFTHVNAFTQRVVGALHRAGVTVIAGSDAMGMPLISPGSSLHHELALLRASGLTPYEALGAATVAPAAFLGKEREFGTIAVGKRADLLLVEGNPLEDPGRLKQPAGVMARGRWLPRERLQALLAALR